MHCLKLIFLISFYPLFMELVNFTPNSDLAGWSVVDDVVMGGRSDGSFAINEAGHAVFSGTVSLENNGGFSSVRYNTKEVELGGFRKVKIRLRGDGKRYQFRLKSDRYDRHAYIAYFQTSGAWETIEITLSEMYPTFRGRKLDMANFPGKKMEELAFLIANKKSESFQLELDKIELLP